MMDFETAIERVLSHEGGYVNNPDDPGGETQWGISKSAYPDIDIKSLTRDDAKLLYERDFWRPVVLVTNDSALRFQWIDGAVNHGMGNATRFVQRAAGVCDDGHFGPVSRAAVEAIDPDDMHLLFMAERFEFWAKQKKGDTFWRGWMRRGAQDLRFIAKDN